MITTPTVDPPVKRFLARHENVRPAGDGWTARCRAHDDHRSSLKIDRGDDGRVLVKCHAGCEVEAIVAAVGLAVSDLFADRTAKAPLAANGRRPDVHASGRAHSDVLGPIIGEYIYHDEHGDARWRVTRHNPKTFRPWHRTPDGGWEMGGSIPVLYGVPRVLAADPRRWVLYLEGERDVERAESIGEEATTNAGGAGKTPTPAMLEPLRGRLVAILPDNDAPGRAHAEAVARALVGIAAEVKIVNLPDLPEKGDLSDALDAGLTKERLHALVDRAPAWTPADGESAPADVLRPPEHYAPTLVVTSLANVVASLVRWLWLRWLARGKVHILGGHAGDGKSTLAAMLAAEFSKAGTLPDGTPAPLARTLFLLAEDALDDTLRPRLDLHGADVTRVFAIEAVREHDGSDRLFNIDKHLAQLEAKIIELKIDILVIDPLTSFMPRSDRNGEGDVRDLLTPLGKLADRTGVAVLCVMHVGKPTGTNRRPLQQLLGATAFGAIARLVWMVGSVPDAEDESRRVLGVVKSNLAVKPQALEWSRAEDGPIVWHGVSSHDIGDVLGDVKPQPVGEAQGFLRDALACGTVASDELKRRAKALGISHATLRRAKDELGITATKEAGVADGRWLWSLPASKMLSDEENEHLRDEHQESKMLTPKDAQVSIFDSSTVPPTDGDGFSSNGAKMLNQCNGEHLRPPTEEIEDAYLCIPSGEHLRSGNGMDDDAVLWDTVHAIVALSPLELADYRAELAAVPPGDPNIEHDLAALRLAERMIAGRTEDGA